MRLYVRYLSSICVNFLQRFEYIVASSNPKANIWTQKVLEWEVNKAPQ